jgi:activator of HSP90 ATPase
VFSRLTQSAGKNKDGEEASGTITIPEVAHDTEEDEYVVCSLRSHPLLFSGLGD